MEWALINFRVTPQDRRLLRVVLLQRGQTLQEYFADVVARELTRGQADLVPVLVDAEEYAEKHEV